MSVVELSTRRGKRCHNWTADEHCATCADVGTVDLVAERYARHTRPDGTQAWVESIVVGPCPFCEVGYRFEFGIVNVATDDGKVDRVIPGGGPWGSDGFWRGRDPGELLA